MSDSKRAARTSRTRKPVRSKQKPARVTRRRVDVDGPERIFTRTRPTRLRLPSKVELRVHAIPLADDDGGRKYTFTAADLAKGFTRANQSLSGAGIELVFDPNKDWHPRESTVLNDMQNSGTDWWVKGNEVAARVPGKIVVFFRHGPGPDPSGWGHAYPPDTGQTVPPSVSLHTGNVNYVAMPNARNWDHPDSGNFLAHEIGHYLGLFHTHPGWGTSTIYGGASTAAAAEQAIVDYAAANGGGLQAFDGDLLADTKPDCCRNIYSESGLSHTSSGPSSITVNGQAGGRAMSLTFTPPRDNVMSYFFWGAPQRFTPDQTKVIRSTLQHPRRRILVEAPCPPDFHGVDLSVWQTCFDYWRWRDRELQTFSVNRVGSATKVSGSFQPGLRFPVWSLMTSAGYQERFERYVDEGMRPARVVVTETPSGPRFSAIWREIEGRFESSHAMTEGQFTKRWKELRDDGWLHTDVFMYRSGSSLRVASTWVDKPWTDYASYYGMTRAVYEQRFKDFWAHGLRVTSFCAYRTGNSYRFAAIWERLPGRWAHWFDMSASGYQAKYDEMAKAGLRLHQIQAYGNRFSAIWTDQPT